MMQRLAAVRLSFSLSFAVSLSFCASFAGVVASIGCDGGTFTDAEWASLRSYRLAPDDLPADPSNALADDLGAAQLGKRFYFERGWSGRLGPYNDGVLNGSLGAQGDSGRISCADCHQLDRGGSDHRSMPSAVSLGAGYSARNAPGVINAAFSPLWQFWDGRTDSLWSQALGPIENPAEANGTRLGVAHLIYDKYRADYERVFRTAMPDLSDTNRFPPTGKPGQPAAAPTQSGFDDLSPSDRDAINRIFANFGKAVAAYERYLTSVAFEPAPFDRYLSGDAAALSPAAVRGARLFIGKAGCKECHAGPMFTDFKFHNIGTPQEGPYVPEIDEGRLAGVLVVAADPFNRGGAYSDDRLSTAHLDALSNQGTTQGMGQFKTPTLRNVNKTAPYMHDGVYPNLDDVMNHYNLGGGTGRYSGSKALALVPLLLTNAEMDDLVEFLRALDDGAPLPVDGFPEGLIASP